MEWPQRRHDEFVAFRGGIDAILVSIFIPYKRLDQNRGKTLQIPRLLQCGARFAVLRTGKF